MVVVTKSPFPSHGHTKASTDVSGRPTQRRLVPQQPSRPKPSRGHTRLRPIFSGSVPLHVSLLPGRVLVLREILVPLSPKLYSLGALFGIRRASVSDMGDVLVLLALSRPLQLHSQHLHLFSWSSLSRFSFSSCAEGLVLRRELTCIEIVLSHCDTKWRLASGKR